MRHEVAVGLICILLMIGGAEHFSIYPLAICMSSLEKKCPFSFAGYFEIRLSFGY